MPQRNYISRRKGITKIRGSCKGYGIELAPGAFFERAGVSVKPRRLLCFCVSGFFNFSNLPHTRAALRVRFPATVPAPTRCNTHELAPNFAFVGLFSVEVVNCTSRRLNA